MSIEVDTGSLRYALHVPTVQPADRVAAPTPLVLRRTRRPAAPARPAAPPAEPPATSTVQVVSTIAHELRTPLATLTAGLEILSDYPDLDAADVRQLVSRLQRGVAWLDCLIENFTTWSAIETGHLALRREEGAAREWVERAVDLVQPLLARRGQRARLVCAAPSPVANVDSVRLGQVVVNLLVNAGKYGVPGDEIEARVEAIDGGLRVAVADHGAGIPLGEQDAIFRPHTRGASASASGVAGHGLGLSIVKAIVEAHGGAVGVTSTPGTGATFWFTIPNGR